MNKNKTIVDTLGYYMKNAFITGILTVLPFTLTLGLFMLSFRVIVTWLKPIQSFFEHPIIFLTTIEYHAIFNQFFLVFVGLFIIGFIIKALLLEKVVHIIENLLFKIPLVRPVYSGIKQLVHAFSVQDKVIFKKVVVVEFPRQGIYSVGFLTSELPQEISPNTDEKFYNVFIPTTPNPTTGFFVILPENSFQTINLTRQEAMAMVISGGIIQPDRFSK
jgi:uncharacterized membrane protein